MCMSVSAYIRESSNVCTMEIARGGSDSNSSRVKEEATSNNKYNKGWREKKVPTRATTDAAVPFICMYLPFFVK